jgi:hypothetical protein
MAMSPDGSRSFLYSIPSAPARMIVKAERTRISRGVGASEASEEGLGRNLRQASASKLVSMTRKSQIVAGSPSDRKLLLVSGSV